MKKIRVLYFIADSYPAWRVDLVCLFGELIKNKQVKITWVMRNENSCKRIIKNEILGDIILPVKSKKSFILYNILWRLNEWILEVKLLGKLLIKNEFDIIQVRDDRYTASAVALLLQTLKGVKFVYWMSYPFPENDLYFANHGNLVKKFFLTTRSKLTTFWLYKVVLKYCSTAFVQSESMKSYVISKNILPEKLTVIPMCVPDELVVGTTACHEIIKHRVVYLGTLAKIRHLEILIESFKHVISVIPDAELWIIGRGNVPEDQAFLEKLAFKLELNNNIKFTGFIPMNEAWDFVRTAQVCVSPIYPCLVLDMGSPTKLYEYLALEKPVVVNHHPEQTYVINNAECGLVVDWGSLPFSNALITLLEDIKGSHEMGKRGKIWVTKNRLYSKYINLVHNKYEELLLKSYLNSN